MADTLTGGLTEGETLLGIDGFLLKDTKKNKSFIILLRQMAL